MADDFDISGIEWQKKEPYKGGQTADPYVSIQKSGRLAFNRPAREKFLKSAQSVELYVDSDNRFLAVKPVKSSEGTSGAFSIQYNEKYGTAMINAVSVLKECGAKPEAAKRYKPLWSDSYGMVVIKLNEPISERKPKKDGDRQVRFGTAEAED